MSRSRRAVFTPGLWRPVCAPYTVLREPLVLAECSLNSPITASALLWRRLARTPGGEHQVVAAVDALLAASIVGSSLEERDDRPNVMLAGGVGLESSELAAVQTPALLLESGGAGRLKRCRRDGCDDVFPGWTNAGSRVSRRTHARHLR